MKVIGLCGGSGSGKGTVAKIFYSHNIPIIDADAIYHTLTSAPGKCLDELRAEFGEEIIKDNALYRPALAKIVFASENAAERRGRLNEITHKFVMSEIRKELSEYLAKGSSLCVVDIPLLFESGFDKECDLTVAVIADREIRLDRIVRRDGISREAAERRISSQISDERLKELTDRYIINSTDKAHLEDEVSAIINEMNII